jgi:hypothetical protein
MGNAQYITDATLTGQSPTSSPADLNPGQPGVDFISTTGSVVLPFPPGITPILVEVSLPTTTTTNVIQIIVVVTASDGTILFTGQSPNDNSNTVTGFPVTPLPEGSTITVTFVTGNNQPAENVTLSVIACYTPTTAATIVTTGSSTGSSTSSATTVSVGTPTSGPRTETPTLIITSTTLEVSQTSGMISSAIHLVMRFSKTDWCGFATCRNNR